jgi:hypothetical protein
LPNSVRYDHFPEPRVASFLPPIEKLRQRNAFGLIAKNPDLADTAHALIGDVAAMRHWPAILFGE